jgi:alanyl-tRNA synthetase
MKSSKQIRESFINFWTSSPRNHKEIPNVSLVPNVDSTLLFTNSGMFPLVPYLSGQSHPEGKKLCNFQRCLRTKYDDMLEVGDNRHTLMFEMMGNWSLGDYFKQEQIPWMLEVYVEGFGLDPSRLYVSVYGGDKLVSRDDEAIKAWKLAFRKYGIEAEFAEDISRIPSNLEEGKNWEYKIFPYKKENWWQRGEAVGELGGPSSEIFYDTGRMERKQDLYHINDDSGRFIEIGNSVFMQYQLDENLKWTSLPQRNIDFGGGFERVVMCAQDKGDIFETDVFLPILEKVSEISKKPYKTDDCENEWTKSFRVIADHARAATFILADGVTPSNKDQGYILRRFIRRLVRFGDKLEIQSGFAKDIAKVVVDSMGDVYPHLIENEQVIIEKIDKEETVFRQTLKKGLRELEKMKLQQEKFDGKTAFYIYETYGFPLELTLDELGVDDKQAVQFEKEFRQAETEHRAKSRAGAEHKFKGGLADSSDMVVKYHTTTHLLLRALQVVLGDEVKQRGSNITAERLRFDFNFERKLAEEEVEKVENIVNKAIEDGLNVFRSNMPRKFAEGIGFIQKEFGQKYPEIVSIHSIGLETNPQPDDKFNKGSEMKLAWSKALEKAFSVEFCGGPHVDNTAKIGDGGKKFKIKKQESVGAGIRRIKAVLE